MISLLDNQKENFKIYSQELCKILKADGVEAAPYRKSELPYFSMMSPDQQTQLIQSFKTQVEVGKSLQAMGLNITRSNYTFLAAVLTKLNLALPSEALDSLDELDYMAVYNHFHQMILLTPNHLAWMTYTLEDLHCRAWYQLFKREETVEKELMKRAAAVAMGQTPGIVFNTDIPAHLVTELDSSEKRWVNCHSKLYSPVYKSGKLAGFLSSNQDRVRAH